MPSIQQSLDALDSMVTNHASTPEIRSQIAHIAREVAALEAEYASAVEVHAKFQQAQLVRDQNLAAENKRKVGVTLTNGVTKYYDADTYAVLPNPREPKIVEFRKSDKQRHTYHVVATARWSEVAEVHEPEG
jgi:hypothetical protein